MIYYQIFYVHPTRSVKKKIRDEGDVTFWIHFFNLIILWKVDAFTFYKPLDEIIGIRYFYLIFFYN